MTYTWDDIYKEKTDRELFAIYVNGTIAEKNKAAEYLTKRGFDFENVQKYKDEWELEKLIKEYQTWKTGIYEQITSLDLLPVFPMMNIIAIIVVVGDIIFQLTGNKETNLLQSFYILIGLVVLEFILIWIYKRREQKRNSIKARIKELKDKIKNK